MSTRDDQPDDRTARISPDDLDRMRPPPPVPTRPPGSTPSVEGPDTAPGRRSRRADRSADPQAAARARAAAGLTPEAGPPAEQAPPPPSPDADRTDRTGRAGSWSPQPRDRDAVDELGDEPDDHHDRDERSGSRTRTASTFGRAAGLTVLGALVPGSALLAAGWKKSGAVVLTVFVLLLAGLLWLATAGQRTAVRAAVDPGLLLGVMIGVGVLAALWIAVVVLGYRLLLPRRTDRVRQGVGAALVLLLAAAVAVPAVTVVQLAGAQRDLVDTVFADGESATVVEPADPVNPFGDQERVNVLLLGGDGGDGREGVRTDTVIVASIETATGATTLFSLPRNLEDLPFPADSPLGELFPDGFDAGSESESLLNAVYRNGPALYPDALGVPSDNPGADWLKLGVGEALGLPIDFYVLVNLDGFSQLVDALGGITVNVNYYVPVGGEPSLGILPDSYIAPGPDQTMSGPRALDYARGRFGLSDYQRMDRQRCVLDAIVARADPVTLLTRYQQLAATTSDIVSTDIPQSVLDDFVDLAFLVKDAGIRSVVFDDTVISPAYPDYDAIRLLVQQALGTAPAPGPAPTTAPGTTTSAPPTSAAPTEEAPVDDVSDACAYDPAAAQAALDAGEPPTRNG
ncbi:transcriptional regulator [Geodermatophilus sp. Leaf369]|uniref:LCP family protein n=1 Tax=Geodermatophilus sp. Leaf369 TaxID=1736354 RepID=UPI0006F7B31B|nr:LCP family protein [Geodermatophilus sp. Leaf369]KQS58424.1 transcriptional regulator [Geodermatophilus sp. Leaf369]